MKAYINDKGLCIETNNYIISNISSYISCYGNHYDIIVNEYNNWQISKDDMVYILENECFKIYVQEFNNTLYVSGIYTALNKVVGIQNVCLLKGLINHTYNKAYYNMGYVFNGIRVNDMQGYSSIDILNKNQLVDSAEFGCLINDSNVLVIGQCTFNNNINYFALGENGHLEIMSTYQSCTLETGEKIEVDSSALVFSKKIDTGLKEYVENVYNFNKIIEPKKNFVNSGWCSWYYYGPNITEEEVLLNIKTIKENNLKLDCIQIDDGWEIAKGDWESNEKFPHGMKWICEKIMEEGMIPGIWVAPLTADLNSKLLTEHPEYFVKNPDDDGIYGMRTLDCSNEDAAQYLYDIFHKLSYEWGYRYIKIDFLAFAFSCGRYSKPNFTGLNNYIRAMNIINSAVTKDTFVLACTAPLMTTIGRADAIRTSMDIFERFDSLRSVAKQVYLRSFMKNVIIIDPDCLMIREVENEDDFCFRLCTRNKAEINTFTNFILSSGGTLMLSDKMNLLSEEKISLIKSLLPYKPRNVEVLNLTDTSVPSIIKINENEHNGLIYIYNWSEFKNKISYNFSDGDYYIDINGVLMHNVIECELEPHTSIVLKYEIK